MIFLQSSCDLCMIFSWSSSVSCRPNLAGPVSLTCRVCTLAHVCMLPCCPPHTDTSLPSCPALALLLQALQETSSPRVCTLADVLSAALLTPLTTTIPYPLVPPGPLQALQKRSNPRACTSADPLDNNTFLAFLPSSHPGPLQALQKRSSRRDYTHSCASRCLSSTRASQTHPSSLLSSEREKRGEERGKGAGVGRQIAGRNAAGVCQVCGHRKLTRQVRLQVRGRREGRVGQGKEEAASQQTHSLSLKGGVPEFLLPNSCSHLPGRPACAPSRTSR